MPREKTTPQDPAPSRGKRFLRISLRIVGFILAALILRELILWSHHALDGVDPKSGPGLILLLSILGTYAVLLAIPFVPGIEIGITLIMAQGASVAHWVYLSTVIGLAISYLAGHYLPYSWLRRGFAAMRLTRAETMVRRIEPLGPHERLDYLHEILPRRLDRLTGAWRYVLLAILINLPGNALIGGGGGIMMIAGLSRLFIPVVTLVTVALAMAPIPMAIWAFGPHVLRGIIVH